MKHQFQSVSSDSRTSEVSYHLNYWHSTFRAVLGTFTWSSWIQAQVRLKILCTVTMRLIWLSFILHLSLPVTHKNKVSESSQVEKIVTVTVVVREQHIWHERHPVWSELPAPAPLETSVHSLCTDNNSVILSCRQNPLYYIERGEKNTCVLCDVIECCCQDCLHPGEGDNWSI